MEKIEELIDRLLDRCAATGASIIRLDDGEVLYLRNRSRLPDDILELACRAAYEMFNGNLMKSMLESVVQYRGENNKTTYLESIRFTFSNTFHWITLVKDRYIVVLIAPRMGISPGYTETLFRSFLPRLSALLP